MARRSQEQETEKQTVHTVREVGEGISPFYGIYRNRHDAEIVAYQEALWYADHDAQKITIEQTSLGGLFRVSGQDDSIVVTERVVQ